MRRTAVFLIMFAGVISAQQAPRTIALRGRVDAADTRMPLPRVRVAVIAGLQRIVPALTDDEGRFALTIPANTRFALTATKAGYATATTASSAKESAVDVVVRLPRSAAISGRVVDGIGAPVVESLVTASLLDEKGSPESSGARHSALTDDLGEYRIGGLPPGRYALGAGSGVSALRLGQRSLESIATARAALEQSLIVRPPAQGTLPAESVRQTLSLRTGDEVRAGDIAVRSLAEALQVTFQVRPAYPVQCVEQGSVEGRVVTTAGAPVADAHVAVRIIVDDSPRFTTTHSERDGTFRFGCLQPGEYALEAAYAGHRVERYGDTRGAQITLWVRADQTTTAPDVVVQRAGAMAGSVVDEHGEPMIGVTVQALQIRYAHGRRALVPAGRGRPTDDRGQFRLYDLPTGSYVLMAVPEATVSTDAGSDYVPLFHPGTPAFEGATRIEVASGRDVLGLNFVLTPLPAATISGVVRNAAGEPLVGSVLLAVSHRSGAIGREPLAASIAADGTFQFSNLAPGEYVIHALGTPAFARSAEFGSEYVVVTESSSPPVAVRTNPGLAAWGRVTIDGERRSTDRYSLIAHPADPDRTPFAGKGTPAVILEEGLFSFSGLDGPTRFVLTTAPHGWYLKSVVMNGIDVADGVLEPPPGSDIVGNAEIVIGTRGATVSGRVFRMDDRPSDGYALVFSTDPSHWVHLSRRVKLARADRDGAYRAEGLPPGEYYVAAAGFIDPDPSIAEWYDPDLLRTLAPAARRVTLMESEQRSLALRLIER